MSVLRNDLKRNFSMIPNEILIAKEISFGARLVYCYLASKPDNWEIWNDDIKKQVGIKDNGTLSKYWKELIDNNWILRERKRDNNGKMQGGFDYTLNNPKMEINQIRVFSEYGENPNYNNTNLNNNINDKNNTNNICVVQDNINEFFDLYNSTVKRLPKALKLTDKRKNKIKLRLKEIKEIDKWKEIFEKCDNSDFCAGLNKSGWQASLDFLIENQTNYIKVLEGKYDNKTGFNKNSKTLEELQRTGWNILK